MNSIRYCCPLSHPEVYQVLLPSLCEVRLPRAQAKPWLSLDCAASQAYSDYNDVMDLTEELVSGLVKAVKGTYKIQYHAGVRVSASAHLPEQEHAAYCQHPARKKAWQWSVRALQWCPVALQRRLTAAHDVFSAAQMGMTSRPWRLTLSQGRRGGPGYPSCPGCGKPWSCRATPAGRPTQPCTPRRPASTSSGW